MCLGGGDNDAGFGALLQAQSQFWKPCMFPKQASAKVSRPRQMFQLAVKWDDCTLSQHILCHKPAAGGVLILNVLAAKNVDPTMTLKVWGTLQDQTAALLRPASASKVHRGNRPMNSGPASVWCPRPRMGNPPSMGY